MVVVVNAIQKIQFLHILAYLDLTQLLRESFEVFDQYNLHNTNRILIGYYRQKHMTALYQ